MKKILQSIWGFLESYNKMRAEKYIKYGYY